MSKEFTNQSSSGKSLSNVIYTRFNISEITIDEYSSIRHQYDQEKLEELAESIRQNNNELLQPIIITRIVRLISNHKDTKYRIIAGRRRFLACRDILKLDKISAIVKEFDSFESEFKAQFAENEERVNWTDIDYVKAISFLKERNPDITQIEIANVFGKNLNWIKKKQQHLNTVQEIPESSSPNLSTSILSELQSLPAEEKKNIINQLNNLAKEGHSLPSIKTIRSIVQETNKDIKLGEKIMPVNSSKKEKIKTQTKKESFDDSKQAENIHRIWKNSGIILGQNKIIIMEYLNSEIQIQKTELYRAKEKIRTLESSLKDLISDSIALQELPLFPTESKAGKR